MKVICAPDSFKGSLSAVEAAEAMAKGWLWARPDDEVVLLPLADGGEGTVEALLASLKGKCRQANVSGPLGAPVDARWGLCGDLAVMEMAAASGLLLLPEEKRNPLYTTTYGTGELIRTALDAGVTRICLGIGGSATNDGGVGMAQALGAVFIDKNGLPIPVPACGESLSLIAKFDLSQMDPRLKGIDLQVACDVDNPLFGEHGAAHVYAPQKGASPDIVKVLDDGLHNLSTVINQSLGMDISTLPGAGAAGGLGAGLVAFCGGRLVSGIEMVLDSVQFDAQLTEDCLVLTGEGQVDRQTLYGKTISGILNRTRPAKVPIIILAGRLDNKDEILATQGVTTARSLMELASSVDDAMAHAGKYLKELAAQTAQNTSI
jgi:glycerate 2-kinase